MLLREFLGNPTDLLRGEQRSLRRQELFQMYSCPPIWACIDFHLIHKTMSPRIPSPIPVLTRMFRSE